MNKIYYGLGVSKFDIYDPVRNHWVIRWGIETEDEITFGYEKVFQYKPQLSEIKETIIAGYNEICNVEIVENLEFNGKKVWLSIENQQNYKMLYDYFAKNTTNLPLKVKLYDENGVGEYEEFESFEDYEAFYFVTIEHINSTLAKYWEIKDNIDWLEYEL